MDNPGTMVHLTSQRECQGNDSSLLVAHPRVRPSTWRKLFGETIAKHREAKNWTQLKLAQKLNYKNSQNISEWERGVKLPPKFKLLVLANELDLDPTFIETIYRNEVGEQVRQALHYGKRDE